MLATIGDFFGELDAGDWVALGVGFLGFLTGAGALVSSRRSNKLAKEANAISRDAERHSARAVELAEEEAGDRQRLAEARAAMEAALAPLQVTAEGSAINHRPTVTVTNAGSRDSGPTVVRVYMPVGQSADSMCWDDEWGKDDRFRPIQVDDEPLYSPQNSPLPTQYIERQVSNVSTTMAQEWRVVLPLALPSPGMSVRTPVRITVRAENAAEVVTWFDHVQTFQAPPT